MDIEVNFTDDATEQVKMRACQFLYELPDEMAGAIDIFVTTNSVINVLTVVFNASILLAIWKTPSLRKPSHILIGNLAFSDFLVGAFGLLFLAMDAGFKQEALSFRCLYSLIRRAFLYWLGGVSLYTLVVISVDRVLAVKLKASYGLVVTAKRVKLVLSVWWIIFGAYVSFLASWDNFTFKIILRQVAVVTCILIASITASYAIAAKELRKLASQVSSAPNQNSQDSNTHTFDTLKYHKSLKTMIIVFFATILFYVPFFCLSAVKSLGNFPSDSLHIHFRIAEVIAVSNSLINPVVYLWRMSDLRQAVNNTLRKVVNH